MTAYTSVSKIKMSSSNSSVGTSQAVPHNQITGLRVQTLHRQLVDLSSEYWVLHGEFWRNPLMVTFTVPIWYSIDQRALSLQTAVHGRALQGMAALPEQVAEFHALDTIREQIRNQLTALEIQLRASNQPQIAVDTYSTGTIGQLTSQPNPPPSSSYSNSTRHNPNRSDVLNQLDPASSSLKRTTDWKSHELSATGHPGAISSYIPEFPGLVDFPAPRIKLNLDDFKLTGKVRKPISSTQKRNPAGQSSSDIRRSSRLASSRIGSAAAIANLRINREEIARTYSEDGDIIDLAWTTGSTTAQKIWERQWKPWYPSSLGRAHGSALRSVLSEVEIINRHFPLHERGRKSVEAEEEEEGGDGGPSGMEMDNGDSDYKP